MTISKLKQDVQRRKNDKAIKKLKRGVLKMNDLATQITPATTVLEPEDSLEPDKVLWSEAVNLQANVANVLLSYKRILDVAGRFKENVTMVNDKDMANLDSLMVAYADDITMLSSRWDDCSKRLHGNTGEVAADDIPRYYEIFETIMSLGADINAVLATNAVEITTILQTLKEIKNDTE